jgi:hypothetical protein
MFIRHGKQRALAVVLFHLNPVRWTRFGSLLYWNHIGYFWMRQRHCASEIPWAINQKVWSKKDVHPWFPGYLRLRHSISYHSVFRSAFWEGQHSRYRLHDSSAELPDVDLLVIRYFICFLVGSKSLAHILSRRFYSSRLGAACI